MVGEVLADRYELEQLVGSGGMSTVYRARDRVLERTVALKVLHQRLTDETEYVERFRREARMVAGLSHPNIVTVIDRGDHDGRPFIVFEFIDGENLKQLVDRIGPLAVERALELAIQVARGLAFAHAKGFVHRDVKPQNVLLNGNGEAKVTDFGIARSLDVKQGVTLTGTVLGTSDYISPEQAQGRQVDEHSDVYSLGVVLYELLTGELPFSGDNFVSVAMQHINVVPAPASLSRPEVPARVDAAIEKALAKEPEDRFASMSDFSEELETCLEEALTGADGSPTGVLPALARPRRGRPPRRRPRRSLKWPGLIAAGLALGCVAIVLAITQGGGSGGNPGGTGAPISLTGVASYDPFGDNHTEHSETVGRAADGSMATFWETENYKDGRLNKEGVGLVLAAPTPVTVHQLTVMTTTPGFTAVIKAGDSRKGPFRDVSSPKTVAASTTFALSDAKARYFVVWITNLGPSSHRVRVNEVTSR
jgi:eukaryotic-like serine/threonine-protein kinase